MSEGIAMAEVALLGTLIVAPYLSGRCAGISGADFCDTTRGQIFDEVLALGELADPVMLVIQLEKKKIRPPSGRYWGEIVASLMDHCCVMDDSVVAYVAKIREASLERRLLRRRSGR